MNKKTCYTKLRYVALMLLLTTVFSQNVFAVRYYWVGGGNKTTIGSLSNWSLTRTGGAGVNINAPTNTTTLVFPSTLTAAAFVAPNYSVVFAGGAIDSLIVEAGCTVPIQFNLGTLAIGGSLLFNNAPVTVAGSTAIITFSSSRPDETINPGTAKLTNSTTTGYVATIQNTLKFNGGDATTYHLADKLACSNLTVSNSTLDFGGNNLECQEVLISGAGQINIANSTIDCSMLWAYSSSKSLPTGSTEGSLIKMGFRELRTSPSTNPSRILNYYNVEFVGGNHESNPTRGISMDAVTSGNPYIGTTFFHEIKISKGSIDVISKLTTAKLIISTGGTVRFGKSSVNPADTIHVTELFEAKPPAAVNGGQVRLYGTNTSTNTQIINTGGRNYINMGAGAMVDIERAVIYDLKIMQNGATLASGSGYKAHKSYDWGNTSGFDFPPTVGVTPIDAGKDLYWTGGAGKWGDPIHWSTDSAGVTPAGCIPSLADNVFFYTLANNHYSDIGYTGYQIGQGANTDDYERNGVSLDMDAWCNNMTWRGVPAPSSSGTAPYFDLNGYNGDCGGNIMIGGSLVLQSNLKITGARNATTLNQLMFVGDGANTITTNGCPIPANFVFQSANNTGSWILNDDLVLYSSAVSTLDNISGNVVVYLAKNIVFNRGTLNFNGRKVVASGFVGGANSTNSNFEGSFSGLSSNRILNIANSTIDLALTWQYTGGQPLEPVQSANSFILAGCTSGSSYIQVKGGDHYYNAEKRKIAGTVSDPLVYLSPLPNPLPVIYFNKLTLSYPSGTGSINSNTTNVIGVIQPDSLLLTGSATYNIQRSFTVNKYLATSLECGGSVTIGTTITDVSKIPTITMGTIIPDPADRVKVRDANINVNIATTGFPTQEYTVYDCTVENGRTGWHKVDSPAETYYWVGNITAAGDNFGSGNWSDGNNWSKFSGSHRHDEPTPMGYHGDGSGCVPRSKDNVVFDDYSFINLVGTSANIATRTVTIDKAAVCDSMSWIGSSTLVPQLSSNNQPLTIAGSLLLQKGMKLFNSSSSLFPIKFITNRVNESITTNGVAMSQDCKLTFEAADLNSGWKLQDSLILSSRSTEMIFNSGTLDTQGNTIRNFQTFTGNSGNSANRKLIITGSTISSQTETGTSHFDFKYTGTLEAANTNIKASTYGTLNAPAGTIFHNLEIDNLRSIGGDFNVYRGKFDKITVTKPGTRVIFGNTSGDLVETDTIILANDANHVYEFASGSTLRVNEAFYGSGTPCFKIYLRSTEETVPAIFDIKRAAANYNGTDTCKIDYAYIHGITALTNPDNAKLYKGSYSPDANRTSNVSSGWGYGIGTDNYNSTLINSTTTSNWPRMDIWVDDIATPFGDDVILACKNLPYTLRSDNFMPTPNATFQWYQGNDRSNPLGTAATQEVSLPGDYWLEVDYAPGSIPGCKLSDDINIRTVGTCPSIIANHDQIVPSGANTVTLTSTPSGGIPSIIGNPVNYTYQWYIWDPTAGDGLGEWKEIGGATGDSYTLPTNLTTDAQYSVVVYDNDTSEGGANSARSNTVTVRVLSVEADENQTILAGAAPDLLISTVQLTDDDDDDDYEYQWEYWDGDSWEPVPTVGLDDGTNATYQPGNLTNETIYRVEVTKGDVTAISNEITIKITELTSQNEVLCGGEVAEITLAPTILTAGGTAYWFPSIENALAAADYAIFDKTSGDKGDSKEITKNTSDAVERFYIRIEKADKSGWTEKYPAVLNVFLVPDSLIWTGGGTADDWHDAANWSWTYPNTKNPDPGCVDCQPYWIPIECTNVLIPKGKAHYPDLTSGTGGTVYTPDTRYESAACNNIHFEYGGEVARTDLLTYAKAFVELKLNTFAWHTISAPLQDMYSGDYAFNRVTPTVQMKLFNSPSPQTGEAASTADWSATFNTDTVRLLPTMGYNVRIGKAFYGTDKFKPNPDDGLLAGATPSVINDTAWHFPKDNLTFLHYDQYSLARRQASDQSLPNATYRTNRHRFIYESNAPYGTTGFNQILATRTVPYDYAGKSVLLGNPFMADLDFEAFYAVNYAYILPEFEIILGSNSNINETVNFSASDAGSGTYAAPTGDPYIAPMQSFIVRLRDAVSLPCDLNFVDNMSVLKNKLAPSLAPRQYQSEISDVSKIDITATRGDYTDRATVQIYPTANNNYQEGEDAKTLIHSDLNNMMMNVFTQTDNLYIKANRMNILPDTLSIGIVTSGAGTTTLKLNNVNAADRRQYYFEDKLKNVTLPIFDDEFIYQFTETGNQIGRFRIYTNETPVSFYETKTGDVTASIYNKTLNVLSKDGSPITQIEIFDTTGRLLYKNISVNSYYWQYPTQALGNNIVILKTTTRKGSYVHKVVNL